MKKAKIFLTALTVLAIVGGALAFKARGLSTFGVCNTATNFCDLNTFQALQTTAGGTVQVQYDLSTKPCINGICTTKVTTFN
jgi:hypothetical protein